MTRKILLVDDEVNLLQSLRRSFHGRFEFATAIGGQAALKLLREAGPFAVVVSDMQMPEVNGLTVLSEAKKVCPDSVRIMLTGNVDQQTVVDAINSGAVFRFLNKPCPLDRLGEAIEDGLKMYSLVVAEKQLLSQTLTGAIALLSDVLALSNPKAFGRGGRLRYLAKRFAETLGLGEPWQYEIAAMLSQIGFIGTHGEEPVLGMLSTAGHAESLKRYAAQGAKLTGRIPRLENVARMIEHQFELKLDRLPEAVQNGAKILRILHDFDIHVESQSVNQAIAAMHKEGGHYDGKMLAEFARMVLSEMQIKQVSVTELEEQMVLEEDVLATNGEMLIRRGHELTMSLIHRLKTLSGTSVGVREPIVVRCSALVSSTVF